jgi:hypothetical protein
MRHATYLLGIVSFLTSATSALWGLGGCGGRAETIENPAPSEGAPSGSSPPSRTADPAPANPTEPAPATTPAPPGDAKATRDGAPLSLRMCKTLDASGATLQIWGEITDPSFAVDEGIIAIDVTPPSERGTLKCGSDVKLVFAEGRGAEFEADPNACAVTLENNALGQVVGRAKGEYVDAKAARHSFTVEFSAGDCP